MFQDSLRGASGRIHACLTAELADHADVPVVQAMRYALKGGKGLRGFLVIEGARLHGVAPDDSVFAAAAVEAIHAYSLVHDDLPCMDDDELRRGQPTVHVKWDEATAVLAGDALQTLAFGLLANEEEVDAEIRLSLISSLAKAAGAAGMVLGQAQDIAAETASDALSLDQITALQANKTGALIRWAGEAGAVLGRADSSPLRQYAQALGLAFQIADDILDIEGDQGKAGKKLRKDTEAGKATFVSHLGLDGAKAKANALVAQAEDALAPYGTAASTLQDAARFVIARES